MMKQQISLSLWRPALLLFAAAITTTTIHHGVVHADIVYDNELIIPEEIFDFTMSTDSDVFWTQQENITKYFCIFRSKWDRYHQPEKFPTMARWSNPVLYSSTKQFVPWLKSRSTSYGIEKVAESGFTDTFQEEIIVAGEVIGDYQEGKGFYVNQKDWDRNYVYMPGVKFDGQNFNFLSGMASMQPSPCWFTGFYLFDTIDEYDRTFWDRWRVSTFPWNAGTDSGQTYTSIDNDLDPPQEVRRIFTNNAPNGNIFVDPSGNVPPVAEWDCLLHTCPQDDPNCEPEHWPPANECDRLRFPGCEMPCDPETEKCEECEPRATDFEERIFFQDCCESNYEPKYGQSCQDQNAESMSESVNSGATTAMATTTIMSVLTAVAATYMMMW